MRFEYNEAVGRSIWSSNCTASLKRFCSQRMSMASLKFLFSHNLDMRESLVLDLKKVF
jgi:hypothetical protein